jgi:hypothetical protein
MKFFLSVYDNYTNRPSIKYKTNIFFLKVNSYFSMFNFNFINIYIKIKKLFIIKIFQFKYSIYFIFLIYFILLNLLIQLICTLLVII